MLKAMRGILGGLAQFGGLMGAKRKTQALARCLRHFWPKQPANIGVSIVSLFLFFAGQVAAQTSTMADVNAPSRAVITSAGEPGEPLIVSGVVFDADGKTPVVGASVYVYQTDAEGVYTQDGKNDSRHPRLKGYMRTDVNGRYEYRTIKPAPYPQTNAPAHIHYHVNASGYRERVFETIFEGDPKLSAEIRAIAAKEYSAFSLQRLTRDANGVLRCIQNINLRKP
jgi:protocatechuate 3,4-dioxygenase beta subunit